MLSLVALNSSTWGIHRLRADLRARKSTAYGAELPTDQFGKHQTVEPLVRERNERKIPQRQKWIYIINYTTGQTVSVSPPLQAQEVK